MLRGPALAVGLALIAAGPSGAAAVDVLAQFEALLREALDGDLARAGTLTTLGGDAQVTRALTGHEALDLARRALGPEGPAADDLVAPRSVGAGDTLLSPMLGWPRCDALGLFVFYRDTRNSVIAHAESRPLLDLSPHENVCGQPARRYQDVTFDLGRSAGRVHFACGVAQAVHPSGDPALGVAGGWACNTGDPATDWRLGCFAGDALILQGNFGFSLAFDFLLGARGTWLLGAGGVNLGEGPAVCAPGP